MSMTALMRSSLRNVSRCLRIHSQTNVSASGGEAAVHRALGAEGAYWNIGIGPYTAYTAFRQMGQQTPRALTGPGYFTKRAYQSYNSFVRSYQYGRRPSRFDCETALRLLVGANVVAWINWQLDPAFMAKHFMTSLDHIRTGRWYTIVTACFSHRDPLHLLGNMITLYFFWNRAFSGRLVMFLYLVGGAMGSAAFLLQEYRQLPDTQYMSAYSREVGVRRSPPALGASGSVNASVIFNILYSPYSTVLIYGILPMPAWALGGLWLAYDINGAMGRELTPGRASVGYAAHLGGAATGALTYFAYRRGRLRL